MSRGRRDDSGERSTSTDRSVRLWMLCVLTVAGVALAGAGTALGLGDVLGETDGGPEIAVSGDNITVVTGENDRTTVMDLSGVSQVEITLTDDRFRIDVERNGTREETQLTEADRTRALAITHGNETVTEALDAFDNHEMSVHTFRELAMDDNSTADGTSQPDIELGRENGTDTGVDVYLEDESDGNSVTVRRTTTPGGQTVAVTVTGTWMEQRSLVIGSVDATDSPGLHTDTHVETYSLAIDLESGEIVEFVSDDDCCP